MSVSLILELGTLIFERKILNLYLTLKGQKSKVKDRKQTANQKS